MEMIHSAPDTPCLRSSAFADIPAPAFADVVVIPIPSEVGVVNPDPAYWAKAVFNPRTAPRWVQVLFGVRQAAVRLIGVPPATADVFRVVNVVGDEALISTDDLHLDFRCGVGIDVDARLLRVTTVVRLKGRRGRVYFAPVSLLHGPVTRSMARHAVTRAVRAG